MVNNKAELNSLQITGCENISRIKNSGWTVYKEQEQRQQGIFVMARRRVRTQIYRRKMSCFINDLLQESGICTFG